MAAAASGLKGKLTVTVHQAKDLKDVQLLGKQDPYVTLIIGAETFKTKVVANAGNSAEWNQAFLFNLTGVEDALHIKVNDKETLIDRPIARCDIGLLALCQKASKGPTTFQLVDVDNFNQMAGQLSLSVEFNGTGLVTSSTTTPSAVQQTPPMQQPTQSMQPSQPSVPVQTTTQPTPTPVAAPSATQQQHDVHKDKDKKDKDKKDKKDKKKDKKGSKKGSKKEKKGSKKKKKHEGSHSGNSDSSSSGSDTD